MTMTSQLPPAFIQSGRGERVVETLQGLSAGDLEFVLQGPDCHPEFASLLGTASVVDEPDEFGGFDELEMMIGCCGSIHGPLSELLRAMLPEQPTNPTKEISIDRQVPMKSDRSLPKIVAGLPLMAHAAAVCSAATSNAYPSKLPPKAPALDSLASARSASMLSRFAFVPGQQVLLSRSDLEGPRPRPKVPASVPRSSSLPVLRPLVSPQKAGLLSGLPGRGPSSCNPHKVARPLRSGIDFMHMDIEF